MPINEKFSGSFSNILPIAGKTLIYMCSLVLTIALCTGLIISPVAADQTPEYTGDYKIIDALDYHICSAMDDAYAGAMEVRKHFWLPDDAVAGQIPNQDLYGQSEDPAQLGWLLEDANPLLNGQSTLFTTETPILEGSVVNYYLDDSIMAITWKQVFENIVYTISEVKIDDPSQFRRHLADNEFGSAHHYFSTEMSKTTNAVVAINGDFYHNRDYGIVVYDRQLLRFKYSAKLDACFVDSKGNLNFAYRGELPDEKSVQDYVQEHDIVFAIAFGPVLIDNGVRCEPPSYPFGEVNDRYPRAALCQYDELHYLLITVTGQGPYRKWQNIHDLAKIIDTFGVQKAYTLDGGRTANLIMNHQLINELNYDSLRPMSDILYFATAVPHN